MWSRRKVDPNHSRHYFRRLLEEVPEKGPVCTVSRTLHTRTRADPFCRFLTLGGFADFMLPSVLGGAAHGAIMGLANVYPVSISQ
jgi:dihydrodipicolinate synthase/N-acetylneuraminate lyase